MTIALLVQILILAALLFAIAELRILTRDLGRILSRLSGDRELRENLPDQMPHMPYGEFELSKRMF